MTSRVVPLAAAVVLLIPAAAAAQTFDPEANSPYLWRVVVKTEPHPLLTSGFRAQLKRDLLAALQPALGSLGTVEVVTLDDRPRDQWDPFWEQFAARGFAGLAAPKDLTGVKTHFLHVEIRDGVYHLESRQHDGFTGLFSPPGSPTTAVRKRAVREADLVGRAAGLMVDADFGLAGTVEPIATKSDEVMVRFRGGQVPGAPVNRFVKVGDVLAVAIIRTTGKPAPALVRTVTGKVVAPPPGATPPPGYTAAERDFTLLRVTDFPKDTHGVVRCRVLTRFKVGLPADPSIAGYRCLRLETVEAPVAVRLVGTDGQAPKGSGASQVSIRATDTTFTAKDDAWENLAPGPDGRFRAARPLRNVALVQVSVGSRTERFPVPITGTEPVRLQFAVSEEDEQRAAVERACQGVFARAADARLAQDACFKAVAERINARQNKDALARAKAGQAAADVAAKGLDEDIKKLQGPAERYERAAAYLAAAERQQQALAQANAVLTARIGDLEGIVTKGATEVTVEGLNAQLGLLLSRGDVEEALLVLTNMINLRPSDESLKARKAKLEAEWKVKDDVHAKAREFLLKKWPGVATIPDMADNLGSLRSAVDTCRKNGDKHTLRKLLTQFSQTAVTLARLEGEIDTATKTGEDAAKKAADVRTVLSKVEQEITAYLKSAG
jgi:hypothetical protein